MNDENGEKIKKYVNTSKTKALAVLNRVVPNESSNIKSLFSLEQLLAFPDHENFQNTHSFFIPDKQEQN